MIKDIKEWYNTIANSYDELYEEEQRKKLEIIKKELEGKKFKKGLDAGCGTGISTEYLLNFCEDVVAVDISEKMVEKAKRKLKNVKFLIKDLKDIDFKEEFDLIFCITVLQDDENPEKILEKLKEALKKDGLIVISVLRRKRDENYWKNIVAKYFKIEKVIIENKDVIFICKK